MLTAQLLSAQNGYPYRAIINGDTVGVFSIPQVTRIDTTFQSNADCHQQLNYARTENQIAKRVIKGQKLLMNKYIEDSLHLKEITLNQDTVITKNKKTIKRLSFSNTALKIGAAIAVVGDVFLAAMLYFTKPK